MFFLIEDSRALAANVRGIGMTPQEVPEWKKHVIGGKKSSFGKKTDMSLVEQRQSLPIFKLRDDLVKVTKRCHKYSLTYVLVYYALCYYFQVNLKISLHNIY